MSDAAVRATLPVLREAGDARLPQYVVALHRPDGWSLREIGDALGVSKERARQIEVRGLEQIARGNRHDISDLPSYTRRKKRHATAVAAAMPPETAALVRSLNEHAKQYRKGRDEQPILTLVRVTKNLIDAGVPMNEVARAAGSDERTYRRRMKRWGLTARNAEEVQPEEKVDSKTLSTEETPSQKKTCKWPDCPSRLGTGACIHG